MKIITPSNGQVLTNCAGSVQGNKLIVEVKVEASLQQKITVNGVPAVLDGEIWTAFCPLDAYKNGIVARDEISGEEICINVYRLDVCRSYCLSVDDNIWFLADLNKNRKVYSSIFDNPYLAVYKRVHDQYGTKVRLNLFAQVDEKDRDLYGDFTLAEMTEQYKEEFVANADWLRLTFHAKSELPKRPYLTTDAVTIREDYEYVVSQIKRFAGAECLDTATTFHFGASNRTGVSVVRSQGVKALMGYFTYEGQETRVSYYLTPSQIDTLNEYGIWIDEQQDMLFAKIDCVLNEHTPEEITQILSKIIGDNPKRGFIEVMIHEQYFYSHYGQYLPDFEQRILTACEWCKQNNFTPSQAGDILCK